MAFGDYAVLVDNFNRADESPLSGGGAWSNQVVTSNGAVNLASNQVGGSAGGICSAWYNASLPGADCEVYATVPVPPGSPITNVRVYARIATPGTAGVDAYFLQYTGNGTWSLFRLTNASATSIASGSVGLSAGDKIGISCVGSTISAYVYTGGAWSLLGSATDATYGAAGYAGIGMNGGVSGAAVDDFYFGTVGAAAAAWVPRAILL